MGHVQIIRDMLLPIPGLRRPSKVMNAGRHSNAADRGRLQNSSPIPSTSKHVSDSPKAAGSVSTIVVGKPPPGLHAVFFMDEEVQHQEEDSIVSPPATPSPGWLGHQAPRPALPFSGKVQGKMANYPTRSSSVPHKVLSRGDQPSLNRGDIVYQGPIKELSPSEKAHQRIENNYRNSPTYHSFRTGHLRLAALDLELNGSSVAKSSQSPTNRGSSSPMLRKLPLGAPPKTLTLDCVLGGGLDGEPQEIPSPASAGGRQSRARSTSRPLGFCGATSENLQRTVLEHATTVDPTEARVNLTMGAPSKGIPKFNFARRGLGY